jgi:hypothetical protein
VLRKPHKCLRHPASSTVKHPMEAYSDLPSLRLAAAFSDALHDAIPQGASDAECMEALALAFVAFARSAIEGGSPKAALVLWASMLLDDVERI